MILVFLPGFIRGGEGWAQLKIGMAETEAVAALGEPLMRLNGKGFEVWIYDNRAEALFYGCLIGWTSPSTGQTMGQSVDIWQRQPGAADAPVFFLPRPLNSRKGLPVRGEANREESNQQPYIRIRG
jgi:hypothetical protein